MIILIVPLHVSFSSSPFRRAQRAATFIELSVVLVAKVDDFFRILFSTISLFSSCCFSFNAIPTLAFWPRSLFILFTAWLGAQSDAQNQANYIEIDVFTANVCTSRDKIQCITSNLVSSQLPLSLWMNLSIFSCSSRARAFVNMIKK